VTAHDLSSRLLVICDRIAAGGRFDGDEEAHLLIEAARILATQPTDAQKIEALKLAAGCGWLAGLHQDEWGDNVLPPPSTVTDMASDARKALRLLGLTTD